MKKQFNIFGTIVDNTNEKESSEDVCPIDVVEFLKTVEEDDEVVFNINSGGGSVFAGVAISNQIKKLKNKTTAKIDSLCASIATCIMCSCKNIEIDENAYIMIHNAWSVVQGDCNTLRKEADLMENLNKVIISFYSSKFSKTEEEIKEMMKAETWIQGKDCKDYFICEVIKNEEIKHIAAKLKNFKFKNIPIGLKMKKNLEEELIEKEEEVVETTETVEETAENELTEETVEKEETETTEEEKPVNEMTEEELKELVAEQKEEIEELKAELEEEKKEIESLKAELEEKEEVVEETAENELTEETVEKRVAGMQSKMQHKINNLTKSFTNKLENLTKELSDYKNQIINLSEKLSKSENELKKTSSALSEKSAALQMLNYSVNKPTNNTNWKNLKGKEFFDYVRKHPELTK